ncbi:MAG TPA: Hpt domain-containing protein [Nitrospiraceae bacterium]|jgi:HPt (histidine-containing phosphotransfer) domain-containing protein|nr:Hpt domain-containing protein [Nitrospiraceae bacterium]
MTERMSPFQAEEADVPVWDETEALAGVDGDRDLLRELAALFVKQGTNDLDTLRRAWAEQDREALAKAAHRLKGAVLQFAAHKAHMACRRLEEVARGEGAADRSLWTKVETEVTRLIQALRSFAASDDKERIA